MPRYRWFPGYQVAAVSALALMATAPGQTFILSQLNTPLREAFGLSELRLNGSYAVATVLAGLPLVHAGRLADRFGVRRALIAAALLFGLGCLALSGARSWLALCAGFFLVRLFGPGALALASQHAVAMWFHGTLGFISGLKNVAVFGLWVLAPPLAVWLIEALGWRGAYVVFALAVWVLVIPATLLCVRDRPEALGLTLDGHDAGTVGADTEPGSTLREAMRTRTYWILAAALAVGPLVGTAVLFDMQPMLAARGIDEEGAAWTVSAFSLGNGLMALPAGWLTDRIRPSRLIPVGMGCVAACVLLMLVVRQPLQAAGAMALFATGQTLASGCGAATLARAFGRAHHGAIRSSLARLSIIGTGIGPLATGASIALTGDYSLALVGLAVLAVSVALAALFLPASR